jgi:AbiV family abortive infection protein
MDEAVETIIANAERLLADARTLGEAKSYRTAIALCILSFEESGKACLVYWQKAGFISDASDQIRQHTDKQRIFIAYRTIVAFNTIGKIVSKDDPGKPVDFSDAGLFEAFQEEYQRQTGEDRVITGAGMNDYLKEHGFYTDIDASLNIVRPYTAFVRSNFDTQAGRAAEAITMARSSHTLHQAMAAVHRSGAHPRVNAKQRKERQQQLLKVADVLYAAGRTKPDE